MSRENIKFWLLVILGAWAIFYKLDYQPLFLWDESRQANNALEMAEGNQFLYPTYEGNPDFWNTKPHLLIILQAICFKIMGPGILALRIPSALAAIICLALWFRFLQKRGLEMAGILLVIILLSCRGFNVYHVARTGDYDALLILFLSAALIEWYVLIEENLTKSGAWRTALFFTLAVLTKSLAALLWLPVFAILLLTNVRRVPDNLRNIVWPAVGSMACIAGYYGLHELLTPGYLTAVWEHEITGRYFRPNEGHVSEWHYYFSELYSHYFEGFVFFLIPAFAAFFIPGRHRRLMVYFGLASVVFIALLSFSETRIHWYMAMLFPMMALLISTGISALSEQGPALKMVSLLCMAGLMVTAWIQSPKLWKENNGIDHVYPQYVLQQADKNGAFPYEGYWLTAGYAPIETWYKKVFERKKIPFRHTQKLQFKPGDTVYFSNFTFTDSLHHHYHSRQFRAPDADMKMWIFVIDSARNISAAGTEKP